MCNSDDLHSLYRELSTQSYLSRWLLQGARRKDPACMIREFHRELCLPVVLCDAFHCVLAVSDDIQQQFEEMPDWSELIAHSFVPDIQRPDLKPGMVPEQLRPDPNREISVGGFLKLHFEDAADCSFHYLMCDIFDSQSLVVKLSVCSQLEFNEMQLRQTILFAAIAQLMLCRRSQAAGSETDEQSRFLNALLKGSTEAGSVKWIGISQDMQGPYVLLCANQQEVTGYQMNFRSFLRSLSPDCLTTEDQNLFAALLHTADTAALQSQLDAFAHMHRIRLIISEPYRDLNETGSNYAALKEIMSLLPSFTEFDGCRSISEFRLYLMFEKIYVGDVGHSMIHPDAIKLAEYDDCHSTEYVRTLFCWLLCERKTTIASAKLYLHRNTVDQRLMKVSDLIDPDWKDPAYLYSMLYSCYIILRDHKALNLHRLSSEKLSDSRHAV